MAPRPADSPRKTLWICWPQTSNIKYSIRQFQTVHHTCMPVNCLTVAQLGCGNISDATNGC